MTEFLGEVAPDAVLRLAAAGKDEPFLAAHHVEAARILTRLFERSRLRQRVTMSYDPTRLGGNRGAAPQGMLADSAADARKRLNLLAQSLPADCWSVLADLCAFDKGLQQIETERGWPRRGAKLVLRIGLDQLCTAFELSPHAEGPERHAVTGWLEERVPMFNEPPLTM
ncbi:DUF6456 domain-containing protein [Devosia rhizoryzae]|uniref:DUF6456 domain-containing protein n=1 Tax=Devosia rhizoryzae TaxID=2774137 RepID=A0ABX7C3Z4_9HYPH|nr:DUF6456 domain-containing protein [Devosia rhizoryzae]QQR37979.1 hypothetical protein JI748_09195 [Devosia rhizoryzae]